MQRLSPAEVHERIAYIESLRQALGDAQTDTALAELRQEVVARALGRPATPTADLLAVTAPSVVSHETTNAAAVTGLQALGAGTPAEPQQRAPVAQQQVAALHEGAGQSAPAPAPPPAPPAAKRRRGTAIGKGTVIKEIEGDQVRYESGAWRG